MEWCTSVHIEVKEAIDIKKVIVVTLCFVLLSTTILLISCSKKTNNSNNTPGNTGTPTVTSSAGSAANTSTPTVTSSAGNIGNSSSTGNTSSTGSANGKTFTVDDLKTYTGQNGSAAYVAVSGTVYDVTHEKRWKNGRHEDGIKAGVDLTEAMPDSPHGNDVLKGLPVVGTLTK